MALRSVETAPDFYGKDIRVGDVVACANGRIHLAVVEGIVERRVSDSREKCGYRIYRELIVRLKNHITGEMYPHTGKQKDSEATVLVSRDSI